MVTDRDRTRTRPVGARRQQQGISLVEVLITLTLCALGLLASMSALGGATSSSASAVGRRIADLTAPQPGAAPNAPGPAPRREEPKPEKKDGGGFWGKALDFALDNAPIIGEARTLMDPNASALDKGLAVLSLASYFTPAGPLVKVASRGVGLAARGARDVKRADKAIDAAKHVDEGDDLLGAAGKRRKPDEPEGPVTKDEPNCKDGICELGCFAAGTMVSTENGDRPIESILQGERVWSRDPRTGVLALKPVLQVFVRQSYVIDLKLSSGQHSEHVAVTPNHPFWVENIGWVQAADLGQSATLLAPEGLLTGHAAASWGEQTKVYNLEVADSHTYFVGSLHAWVHNQGTERCPTPVSSGASRAPKQGTPNSIYEQIGPDGKVRSRTFYDDNGNPFARQDFDHPHAGMQPHEHARDFDAHGRPISGKSHGPVPPGYDDTPTPP